MLATGKRRCARSIRTLSAQAAPSEVADEASAALQLDTRSEGSDRHSPSARQGLSETQLQRNSTLISRLQGKLILAPLTKYAGPTFFAVPMQRFIHALGTA